MVNDHEYDLTIAADSYGTKSVVYYSAWFYFGTDRFQQGKTYVFNVKNSGKQVKNGLTRASCIERV